MFSVLSGLKSAFELEQKSDDVSSLSSGISAIDQLLPRGGLERGALTELAGRRSSGKRTIALAFALHALEQNHRVAWIDGSALGCSFYPLLQLEELLPLSQLVIVRPFDKNDWRARDFIFRLWKKIYQSAEEWLIHGPALELLIIDIPAQIAPFAKAHKLKRLHYLAAKSEAALLFISEKDAETRSLGLSISLLLYVARRSAQSLCLEIKKNKRGVIGSKVEVKVDEPFRLHLDTSI